MKTTLLMTAAALLAGGAALASDGMDFTSLDTDGDAQLSLEEVQTGEADVTADAFASFDADSNGYLSEDEFNTWQEEAKRANDMSEMGSTDELAEPANDNPY